MDTSDNKPGGRATDLYDLLHERFPTHRSATNGLHVTNLGKSAGLSHETMYRCVRGHESKGFPEGRLTPTVATALLELSQKLHPENPIYADELAPFIIPNYARFCDPMSLLD